MPWIVRDARRGGMLMPYMRGTTVDIGRDILWIWKQAGTTGAANLRVESETVSGRVIPNSPSEYGISHAFETASLIPCVTPNWNTTVPIRRIDSAKFYPGFSNLPPAKGATIDYALVRGSGSSVTADAVTHTITHGLNDSTAVVLVSVNWATTVYRVSKAANSMIAGFSIPAPSDGSGRIYWSPQSDTSDIYESGEAVTEGATEHTIVHNAGITHLPMFFLPNWNTNIWFSSRSEIQTTVKLSSPAPSGALLDWRIKEVTAQ